jgi:PAS domain S-box-containing protein
VSPQTALSSQPQTEAPDAVHKSEKRLRSLVEAVPDLIFRLNPEGLYVDWKAGTDGELLVPPELFLGRHFREFLPEPVSDRVAAAIENARRSKKVETLEYELTLPRSGRQIYEARISVTDDGDALAVCRNVTERHRLIAAVESSEQRFRALVEHSFEGCTILDAAGVVVYDSPGSSRLLGFDNDEMLGRNALERIHPDDVERCRAVLAALLQSPHQALTTQFRFQHKDGSWRWVESTARNLLDHPAVRGIVANWRDITERVQSSEAIRRNEERLSALVENGHSGISVLDLQGNVLYSAPSNRRILRHTTDDAVGQSSFAYVHPEDLPAVQTAFGQAIRSSERVAFPRFRARDLAGEWHWIEAAGHNLCSHPSVGGVVINWHDITAHVRAESEQRRTAELFQAVADGTPDAVFVKDRAGRYLLLNQAAARYAGKNVSQMLGQDATILFDRDSARRVSEHDRRVMEQNRPETQDEQLTVGNVTRTFQTTKAPYRDEHGNVIGVARSQGGS